LSALGCLITSEAIEMPSPPPAISRNRSVASGNTQHSGAKLNIVDRWISSVNAFRPVALILPLSGCAVRGASSFVLFGAYFPAWMLCALSGVFGAIAARMVMVVSGLSEFLPFQLFVCAASGILIATATWLLWFGR
jgi:hypothetical protein